MLGNKSGGETLFSFIYNLDTGNYHMRKFGAGHDMLEDGTMYEDFVGPSGKLSTGHLVKDKVIPAAVSKWIFAQLDATAKSLVKQDRRLTSENALAARKASNTR
ncbi:hypothetical protein FACS1894186_2540 [Alphaproteobacteria bacterium]|nr:hypothetical protein FACS1894186_2540 [Alphaproteobacteria bacterium]